MKLLIMQSFVKFIENNFLLHGICIYYFDYIFRQENCTYVTIVKKSYT